ncbi:MAG: hypothetical protein AseanaTS_09050 [Candidatus Pelagadaptatus aseana]|uniref:acyl-CoA transferase n=1 Tax=Candidatus Pelagadaptatus aseana TaxID=3120508 RepID=UPI0039B297A0
MIRYLLLLTLAFPVAGNAAVEGEIEGSAVVVPEPAMLPQANGYLAELDNHTPSDLYKALARAETLFLDGRLRGQMSPASFVLHGPDVSVFFRDNYREHKGLVDLAARLSAFGVVDIQVCETQTGVLGRDRNDLMPFVGTVPFGPAEEERLVEREGYVYF